MANFQKTLEALQPYVIGIRYVSGVPVVDTVFTEGWTVPESKNIKKTKGDDSMNYYMIYSEVEGVGLDDLLAFVGTTIKHNKDREAKHQLLKAKVEELKVIFKNNSLAKLNGLKFSFEEEVTPTLEEFNLSLDDEPVKEPVVEELVVTNEPGITPEFIQEEYVQPNENVDLTEDEQEILDEERRAEQYRKLKEAGALEPKKKSQVPKGVELPPRKKIAQAVFHDEYEGGGDCSCGPDEACGKCIDTKY